MAISASSWVRQYSQELVASDTIIMLNSNDNEIRSWEMSPATDVCQTLTNNSLLLSVKL